MNKLIVFFILFSFPLIAKKSYVYFKPILGNLHKNPSSYSSSLTTISCGFPLEIDNSKKLIPKGFEYVKAGSHYGYVLKEYIQLTDPECFQEKYPHYFNGLDIDLTQLYYWGRLYDHYIKGDNKN